MKGWTTAACFFLAACGNNNEETIAAPPAQLPTVATPVTTVANDTQTSFAKSNDTVAFLSPVNRPSGIYQFMLPYGKYSILHTVAFSDGRYRLQEEYLEKDSTVVDEGTWTPSQGFIWLYRGQLVRGRYSWKGDTLQYFSPRLGRMFSMTKQTLAGNGPVWREKAAAGAVFYGVGTEPFWSVEIDRRNLLTVSMPEWTAPLKIKNANRVQTNDSTVYTSVSDSLQVVTYPYFCSDGMSDFTYTTRVKFVYKGQAYNGCGIRF